MINFESQSPKKESKNEFFQELFHFEKKDNFRSSKTLSKTIKTEITPNLSKSDSKAIKK